MLDVIHSVERMAESLIGWNLEDADTGEPVPTDPAAVMKRDSAMLTAITTQWIALVTGVSDPLDQTSGDTAPLRRYHWQWETLSPLPEPSDVPA